MSKENTIHALLYNPIISGGLETSSLSRVLEIRYESQGLDVVPANLHFVGESDVRV